MSSEQREYFAGLDWASENHHVLVTDQDGADIGERVFKHSGDGFQEMVAWLLEITGAPAGAIKIAIEVPHGPLVEFLLEHGFPVFAVNPKQLDRFRDRFSPAGAKDDSLDCLVSASSLRTDPHRFRKIEAADPILVELREWSRLKDQLTADRTRLTNRLREQLWRYFPAFLQLGDDLGAEWLLDLWQAAPTPAKAARIHKKTLAAILARHRIRRLDADQVLAILCQTPITLLPGTVTAACDHIGILMPRIRLLNQQIKRANRSLDGLVARMVENQAPTPGQPVEQHDATVLASVPGIGRTVLTTLLAEAWQSLRERDYHALRCLCGAAPVTKRSGKMRYVIRRQAVHPRLANAIYHWARTAVQHDPISRVRYATLRARGKSHARALRTVADRLLYVACAMLKNGTLFRPDLAKQIAN